MRRLFVIVLPLLLFIPSYDYGAIGFAEDAGAPR